MTRHEPPGRPGRTAGLGLAAALAVAFVAACVGSVTGSPPARPSSALGEPAMTIFAAASLRSAMEAAIGAYRAVEPGLAITLSTDSTATLRTQIEQGAPADLFLAADTEHPQRLVDEGLATGQAVTFAGNSLALVVPPANPGAITSPADLARSGVKVVAAGPQVPITVYADLLIANLATLPGYPARFADGYAANVVSHEDNVTAVLTKVELGEGDAGLVYRTDAAHSASVRTIGLPTNANVTAAYAGVVVRDGDGSAAAARFLEWLRGTGGQDVLAGFGFTGPPRIPTP